MKLYKLTTTKDNTKGGTLWGNNVTHKLPAKPNPELCSGDVLHAYTDPDLALVLNPIHANLKEFRIWAAEGDVVVEDWDKIGCFELTTLHEMPLPDWYTDVDVRLRVVVRFAKACAEHATDYAVESATDYAAESAAAHAAECAAKGSAMIAANWAAWAAWGAARSAENFDVVEVLKEAIAAEQQIDEIV